MNKDRYVHASTKVRMLESKLLTKEQFNRMIDAPSLEEAIRVLGDTIYAESFNKLERPEDYEKALSQELIKAYTSIKEISPEPEIVDFSLLKYDVHNLKVIFKDHILGKDSSHLLIPIGNIKLDEVRKFSSEGDRGAIDEIYDGIATEVIYTYGSTTDPQHVELVLDKYFFRRMKEIAKKFGGNRLKEYVKDYIDFSNIRSVLRMKKQDRDLEFVKKALIEDGNIKIQDIVEAYPLDMDAIVEKFKASPIGLEAYKALQRFETTNRLSEFEKAMDDYQINFVKGTKYVTFGPEVLLTYLLAREAEIKNIRVILISKLNGLSREFIQERMCEIYA